MRKILMLLIEKGLEIQVQGIRNIMASNDKYIFCLRKSNNRWDAELSHFPTPNFGKVDKIKDVCIKDIIIFLRTKIN